MRSMLRLKWILVTLCVMLTACAAPQKARERYFWPGLPDIPRVEWLGFYQGKGQLATPGFLSEVLGEDLGMTLGFPVFAAGDGMGRLYVSDHKLAGVMIFDFPGKTVRMLGAKDFPEGFHRPTGIGFDVSGNIYVGDTAKKKIVVFTPDEKLATVIDLSKELKSIGFFAVDKMRKRLIIPDIQGQSIVITDLHGKILSSFGKRGPGDGELNFPSSVALDPQGNIVVCDQMNARIETFTPDGVFKSKFGKRGDGVGEFNIIKAVAVDSEGHIYVTDGRSSKLSLFNDAGEILLQVGGPASEKGGAMVTAGGFNFPNGVFIDQNDTIYVADVFNQRVQMFQYLNEKYLREHPVQAAAEPPAPVKP